jgi:hypothetical protein
MRQSPDLRIEALAAHHDRVNFSCGVDELDRYLKNQAGQDLRRKANGVFVLIEPASLIRYWGITHFAPPVCPTAKCPPPRANTFRVIPW